MKKFFKDLWKLENDWFKFVGEHWFAIIIMNIVMWIGWAMWIGIIKAGDIVDWFQESFEKIKKLFTKK